MGSSDEHEGWRVNIRDFRSEKLDTECSKAHTLSVEVLGHHGNLCAFYLFILF